MAMPPDVLRATNEAMSKIMSGWAELPDVQPLARANALLSDALREIDKVIKANRGAQQAADPVRPAPKMAQAEPRGRDALNPAGGYTNKDGTYTPKGLAHGGMKVKQGQTGKWYVVNAAGSVISGRYETVEEAVAKRKEINDRYEEGRNAARQIPPGGYR